MRGPLVGPPARRCRGVRHRRQPAHLRAVYRSAQAAAGAGHSGVLEAVETLDSLLLGFSVALQPDVLWYGFLGCLVGTLVGVLPGIGPLSGISILLPITFGLDATKAIVMLAGIYYGSQYGGSTTS
ncbi:MAG: tripartite tricarboxylate transporter permease, partial [Bradyrhizobiaceae bacterium]|nr:tripartite tricarboxylate transporter permease [Bradyrhizobiaceae bacterium]